MPRLAWRLMPWLSCRNGCIPKPKREANSKPESLSVPPRSASRQARKIFLKEKPAEVIGGLGANGLGFSGNARTIADGASNPHKTFITHFTTTAAPRAIVRLHALLGGFFLCQLLYRISKT